MKAYGGVELYQAPPLTLVSGQHHAPAALPPLHITHCVSGSFTGSDIKFV
jgi:hypothetical protein